MNLKLALIVLVLGVAINFPALSQQSAENNEKREEFRSKEARGWFFYEDLELKRKREEENRIKQEVTQSPPPLQQPQDVQEKVKINSAWLRENMPMILENAHDNPTAENLAAYAYAQRLLLDMSTRFANNMMDFMKNDPLLDENNRRPTTSLALNSFKDNSTKASMAAIDKISKHAQLWFFYKSTCQYCYEQIPVINDIARNTNIEIVAITIDGKRIDLLEGVTHKVDEGLRVSSLMEIQRTPTIVMMLNDGSSYKKISEGLKTLPELQTSLLEIARESNLITENEYQLTEKVRDINSLTKVDGLFELDADRLSTDPTYLMEIMRIELIKNERRFGSEKINGGVQ
jgi:conjugal transfer pilus assembly protein TraF